MFLVTNSGKSSIVLADLNVELKPNQALDLHKVQTRVSPEKSKDLAAAMRRGAIKVLQHDVPTAPQVSQNIVVNEGVNEKELLENIKSLIKEELSNNLPKVNNNDSNSSELKELIELLKKQQQSQLSVEQINQLIANVPSSAAVITEKVDTSAEESYIDEDKILQMHSKAMDKIAKNSKGTVEYSHQKITDESLSNNINELEDIL